MVASIVRFNIQRYLKYVKRELMYHVKNPKTIVLLKVFEHQNAKSNILLSTSIFFYDYNAAFKSSFACAKAESDKSLPLSI
ncbi:hypothetical protein CLV90_2552 [Maribacter spongiicola]|uniref:Uncharacterized protein n=1 Tax=Maribacter spongiicola TaxID=1206753 RepID=A0A4R7K4P3_9FLAO|nr:hypothetical protein CLV90_2552 [Maribacter spongiicola]